MKHKRKVLRILLILVLVIALLCLVFRREIQVFLSDLLQPIGPGGMVVPDHLIF